MNYDEFLDAVVLGVGELAGKEANVSIHQVTKNNGVILHGLVVMEAGRHFSPAIYLEGFYERFSEGEDIADICEKIYGIYLTNKDSITISDDFFMDFNEVAGRIAFRLVNMERNKELLGKIPHRIWNDLAIVYFAVYDDINLSRAVITIYNNHMEMWGVDEDTLYDLAMENTPVLYPAEFKPMSQVVSDMILRESEGEDVTDLLGHVNKMNEEFPMYVLTNTSKTCGAACILYKGVLEWFVNHIESDVYIIPSSIHEVILVPVDTSITRTGLERMVKSVNSEEVSEDEILSDSVYKFTRECGFC